jgi:hypothetical protein
MALNGDSGGARGHSLPGDLLNAVWRGLVAGVAERAAPARHPVLASVARGGGAEARVVVLRGADRTRGVVEIHTDALSDKVGELAAEPRAALVIWDPAAALQTRLRVEVSARAGTAAEWARIPPGAQIVYGGTPPPGTPLDAPEAHAPAPDPARFTVLTCRILEVDALHLGADRHQRALFTRAEGWAGRWIAP